jgi:tetratricopeptide (TPR) repeat protein
LQFSTLDELLLQRIDDLDDFTRKTLHLASVLGQTFTLTEVVGVSKHALSIADKEQNSHLKQIRKSLDIAIKEGILDQALFEDGAKFRMQNLSLASFPEIDKEEKNDEEDEPQSDFSYHFCHDSWRQKILSLLLDSYKRDIHMHAAGAIELAISDVEESDYRTKMRLFCHLKESGSTPRAAELAIDVGKSFMHLGLNSHSIDVYDEALGMWRRNHDINDDESKDDDSIAGFSFRVIELMDEIELKSIIMLLTALGQALGTLGRKLESARAFEHALEVSG